MPHANRNFIIAYVFLVGLPVVGLVGVLKSGRTLAAPISVDGVWQLQADPAQVAALPCGRSLPYTSDTALAISQSGRNFTLSLTNDPKTTASGVLDGTTLKASLVPAARSDEPGCGKSREISLVATVDPKADPRSLAGRLSINNCPACASVEFRAVRLAPPAKNGSR
ncbi:MAG: hypothetical protein WCA49_18525 [Candidatus Sulfotelmatobacter sp.]